MRTKTHELSPDKVSKIGKPQARTTQESNKAAPVQTINLTDLGKGISMGSSTTNKLSRNSQGRQTATLQLGANAVQQLLQIVHPFQSLVFRP